MLIPSGRNSIASDAWASCTRKCRGGGNPVPGSTPITFILAAARRTSSTVAQVPSRKAMTSISEMSVPSPTGSA